MTINPEAICSRKIYEGSSAMFLFEGKLDKEIGDLVKIGTFKRKILKFIKKDNKQYIVCSKPFLK